MVLKHIGVWSVARIAGAIYAALGLLGGLFFALISLAGAGLAGAMESHDMPAFFPAIFGVGAIILFPILYGVIGLVFGALSAALYNLFAGMVGGIELDLQSR